jgi:predicted AAA+ superfamily ATPase
VDAALTELIWRGIEEANPWWVSGAVPPARIRTFRRHAFPTIVAALKQAKIGRGVVVLGPRRVGKTVLLHQVVQQLLTDGVSKDEICFLSLDDVALRDGDIGELLKLVEVRRPLPENRPRYLLLDEVQHSKSWAGWLKRIGDRGDPYRFLATGSSATALRRGGQDAGLGRWREMTLFPWSFREHVQLRDLGTWSFTYSDRLWEIMKTEELPPSPKGTWQMSGKGSAAMAKLQAELGSPPADEGARMDNALVDYFIRGGFPEIATEDDPREARRKLRQDILDRSLGRDITDVANVDTRLLERLFVRICLNPGGLWNEAEASKDLQVSRPTIARYVQILEEAFLIFRLPNLASPVKGQPKVYLVAPAMRQALLALDESDVRRPDDWGRIAENAVVASAVGTNPDAQQIGFWRKQDECDVVVLREGGGADLIEVKRSGDRALRGIDRAAVALGVGTATSKAKRTGMGYVLCRESQGNPVLWTAETRMLVFRTSVAQWLYQQLDNAGGTLRVRV